MPSSKRQTQNEERPFEDSDDDGYLEAIGDFKPGSITKIQLTDFMTHAKATILPGSRLNMVIGANGTGKSTILNAICLGLGGDPKMLGRADDLRSFIRHGCRIATVEIHLAPFPDERPHVLTRVLDAEKGSQSSSSRGKGSSTCYINGKLSTVKKVRELVTSKYKIAIDNLCTFLPQDKVGSFSSFTDQERLQESEKTFQGGTESEYYYNLHMELIEAEKELLASKGNVETVQDNLKRIKHDLSKLEREKERIEERDRAVQQQTLLKQKRLWLEFERVRADALQAKERNKEYKEKLRELKAMLQPLEDRVNKCSTDKKTLESRASSLEKESKKYRESVEKQLKKYENHDEQLEERMIQLQQLESKRANVEKELEAAQEKLDQLEDALKNTKSEEEIDRDLSDANTKAKQARQEYERYKREYRSKSTTLANIENRAKDLQNKAARLNNDADRRKERILRNDSNLAKIYKWLDKNRAQFRRTVWGPVACEVNPKSLNAAAFLEFHAPNRILKAFVVETDEDDKKLYDIARNQLKVAINIIKIPNGRLKDITRLYSPQKWQTLKQSYQVLGYLDEAFTAPDPVLQCLRTWAGVDKVVVRGEEKKAPKDIMEYLMEPDPNSPDPSRRPSGAVVISSRGDKSYRYTSQKSRFSQSYSVKVDDINPAKLLAPGTSPTEKKKVEDELAAVHKELEEFRPSLLETQTTVERLEDASKQLSMEFQHSKKLKENVMKHKTKIQRARNKVKDLETEMGRNNEDEKRKLIEEIMNRHKSCVKALESHRQDRHKLMQNMITSAGVTLNKAKIGGELRAAQQEYDERRKENEELERKARRCQEEFTAIKQQVAKLRTIAEAEAPLVDGDGNPLPLKAKLESLDVTTLVEVDAALDDVEQTINGIQANDGVFRQFERLQLEAAKVEEQLENLTSNKEAKVALIADKSKSWESALENHIAKTNIKFSHYMKEMGCAGEVRLKKGTVDTSGENQDMQKNFKDWGIEILVSYRENTRLQILSAERHSGGERSVATILYLMALQESMVAPFRCVDEINQGLDERNERLVFKRIVANSTAPPKKNPFDHSGQYFLITPKLLDFMCDMENEAMTVQIVFNGAYNFNKPTEWNMTDLMRGGHSSSKRTSSTEEENSENGIGRHQKRSRRSSEVFAEVEE